MLYERKTINISLPVAELKKQSYINAKAQATDKAAFLQLIQVGLSEKESK